MGRPHCFPPHPRRESKELDSPVCLGQYHIVRRLCAYLALAALGALLLSCEPVHFTELVEESPPEQPDFRIGSNPDFSGRASIVAIEVVGQPGIIPADVDSGWSTFWEVRADSARRPARVSLVRYGLLPDRMHSVSGPDSLRAGYRYRCEFRGSGVFPAVGFEITQDRHGRNHIRELPVLP